MVDSNFEKMIKSLQNFCSDLTKKKSDIDHEHNDYVKREELSTVALTGSYLDLQNKPSDTEFISDEDAKQEINNILGGNYYY